MKTLYLLLSTVVAFGSLVASSQAQEAKAGNPAAGEKKIDTCIGCHGISGYQATFPEIYKVPKLAGQNAKYLVSALTEYRKGDRKHPTMRSVATVLSDQDMADIAAFYEAQAKGLVTAAPDTPPEPSAEVAELLKKGNCASCHGANFSKPIDASYPKLAGQYPDYLYAALKAYQTDKNPQVGRNNAIMMGMARPFTHAELKQITAYIGSLPSELQTVEQSRFHASR